MEYVLVFFIACAVIANYAIGLVTLYHKPGSWTHRLLTALTVILGTWTLCNYFSTLPASEHVRLFWVRIIMIITAPMGAITFLLALSFPRDTLPLGRVARFLIATAMAIDLLTAPWSFSGLTNLPSGSFVLLPGPTMPIFALNHLIFTAGSFIVLFRKLFRSRGRERVQLQLFLIGNTITLASITFTNFIAVVFLQSLLFTAIGPTFTLIQAGIIAYAIFKRRFLELNALVARTVSYAFVFLTVIALYTGGLYAAGTVLPTELRSETLPILVTLAVALAYNPIRNFLENATDRVFFKGQYRIETFLLELTRIMASEIDLLRLADGLSTCLIKNLRTTGITILLCRQGTLSTICVRGQIDTHDTDPVTQDFGLLTAPLLTEYCENADTRATLMDRSIQAVYPLRMNDRPVGVLVIGSKASGESLSRNDIHVLDIVSPQAAVALHNALLYEETQQFNVTLQEEITKATANLEQANRRLRELDTLKDEFISIASHDLRSPLATMQNYLWLLRNQPDNGKTTDRFERISQALTRTIHLVNDMLDVSRIEANRIELNRQPVDLGDIAAEVIREQKPLFRTKSVRLSFHRTPAPIMADQERMHQVLTNLISNAVKYTPRGGSVAITTTIRDQRVELAVRDTGIGIAADDVPKVFSKFNRISHPADITSETSTGLGLFITKRLIELSGGTITVVSTPGHGSTFTVSIPTGCDEPTKAIRRPTTRNRRTTPKTHRLPDTKSKEVVV